MPGADRVLHADLDRFVAAVEVLGRDEAFPGVRTDDPGALARSRSRRGPHRRSRPRGSAR
ncbi:hypothetical protein ACIGNX_31005 [Actinosynnema sp. NPDC053489]|uniref:hypothetical protein n=1 Tax=Actinosynnema sp. NPDC053489 TaxID=3363916 RepID=UPI0037C50AFB